MLLGNPSSSSTPTPSKETAVDLITEREFQEIFPDGFTGWTATDAPQELWTMSKGIFWLLGTYIYF